MVGTRVASASLAAVLAFSASAAPSQEDCLNEKIKKLDPSAAWRASAVTLMNSTVMAFAVPKMVPEKWFGNSKPVKTPAVILVDTRMPSVQIYEGPESKFAKNGSVITTDDLEPIGSLRAFPDRVLKVDTTAHLGAMVFDLRRCLAPQ